MQGNAFGFTFSKLFSFLFWYHNLPRYFLAFIILLQVVICTSNIVELCFWRDTIWRILVNNVYHLEGSICRCCFLFLFNKKLIFDFNVHWETLCEANCISHCTQKMKELSMLIKMCKICYYYSGQQMNHFIFKLTGWRF